MTLVQTQKSALSQLSAQLEAARHRLDEIRTSLVDIDHRFTQASEQFQRCQMDALVVHEQARLQILKLRDERTQ